MFNVRAANYEKRRRKVGRPPGGHSNIEQLAGTKRPGVRRKRHRRIVLTLRKKHHTGGACTTSTSTSASSDVMGDYEIDCGGGSSAGVIGAGGDGAARGAEARPGATGPGPRGTPAAPVVRRKRRFESLPARDTQTRRAKIQRYRFEKRTHQKVLHVAPPAFELDATESTQCDDVSPCQVPVLL